MTLSMDRRTAMLAATGAIAGAVVAPSVSLGQGTMTAGLPMSKARGFKVGDMDVVTLLAGSSPRENPHGIFGTNVSDEEFAAVSKANFIPTDVAQFYFTPTLVGVGDNLILFDTGLNAKGISAALSEAGHSTDDVTHVVMTHMHGDHIGGLSDDDGKPTFANASYVTGSTEFDFWSKSDNGGFMSKVKPLSEKFTFIKDGDSVASGITAIEAFGHTPGHLAFMLESNGQQILLMADTANHYVWSLAYPDWEVKFDSNKEDAAKTRRKILGMAASDRIPLIGYHMPFPAAGFVEAAGSGFRYVPLSYQLMG